MRTSLFVRVSLGYILLAVLLSALTLLASFRAIGHHYERTVAAGLRDLSSSVMLQMAPLVERGREDEMQPIVRSFGALSSTRITVIDTTGKVVADSDEDPMLMENHRTRPEVLRALEGGVGDVKRVSSTLHEGMLYVAVPITVNGHVVGVVRASTYVRNVTALARGLELNLVWLACGLVLISMAAALVFSRSLTRPIDQLGVAARRVGEGDFGARAIVEGGSEFRDLADSFNQMTGRIEALVGDLSQRQEQLAGVIAAIPDGLVVLDPAGSILLFNQGFERIAGRTDLRGRPFWEVLRVPEFADVVKAVSDGRRDIVRDIAIGEKAYIATGSRIEPRGGAVLLLRDVTGLKDLERVKRDFVVNLSHELRTPLTSIKGYLETIEHEAGGDIGPYLGVIKRNADRLELIVGDLLRLSELEDSRTRLSLEPTDVRRVVDDAVSIFGRRLEERGLSLEVEAPDRPLVALADGFKLEQVMVNLIDNAIKYTEHGGIRFKLSEEGARAVIKVSDTGIGIPREHLPRIFERFYVVDKSRSRKVGGTGLGLAIVKHIVLMHDGAIEVDSTPGKGTTFTISLPLARADRPAAR